MSLAQELGYVRQQHPDLPIDTLEQTLECRLTGAGFESWEGIAATGPTMLLLASAPGVFSRGLILPLAWSDLRMARATAEDITIAFRSPDGQESLVTLIPGSNTREEDWAGLALSLLVRQAGAIPSGKPLPKTLPALPPLAEAAEPLAEALSALAAQFPRFPRLGLWQGAVLLAVERPARAREVLERLEGLTEAERPGWGRLLAMAAFLSGKARLARSLLEPLPGDPRSAVDPESRPWFRLGLLATAMLEGLPGEAVHGGVCRSLSGSPLPHPGFPFLRAYQAHRLFQIDGYAALRDTLWGARGWLLEAWSALGADCPLRAEECLDRYRQEPGAQPLELIRLEAALRHHGGDFELALRMLQTARLPDLDQPLLALALRLGRTDLPLHPPPLEHLPMIAPDRLLTWIDYLLMAGRREEAGILLQASASRREALPPFQQVHFRICEAEFLLQEGRSLEAAQMVLPILRLAGCSDDGGSLPPTLAGHDLDLFTHPGWSEGLARACLIAAEARMATADLLNARRWVAYARVLAENSVPSWLAVRLTRVSACLAEPAAPMAPSPSPSPGSPGSPGTPGMPGTSSTSGTTAESTVQAAASSTSSAGREPFPSPPSDGDASSPGHQKPDLRPASSPSSRDSRATPPLDRLAEMGRLWKALRQDGLESSDPELADDLARLPRCQQRPLLVAVLGEFNAGKSTLVNALLGEPWLPTGITPTTRLPCLVRWGPAPLLLAIDRAGTRHVHPTGDLRSLLDERAAADQSHDVLSLELCVPHPLLRDLWFLDLPGLNSRFARHRDVAQSYLREADAIWWVSNATQLGQATERTALGDLVAPWHRVWAILNHLDEIPEEERSEVVAAHAAWMQGHATVLAALAARPAAICPAIRATWDEWLTPFRAAAALHAQEASRRRVSDLIARLRGVFRETADRARAILEKPFPAPPQSDDPLASWMVGDPVWETLAGQARALLESGEARHSLGRARLTATLQDLANACEETCRRAMQRAAENLLFPTLETWAGLGELPGAAPARGWANSFRVRAQSRLSAAALAIRATIWEVLPMLLLLPGNGRPFEPISHVRECLTHQQRRWFEEFRIDLANADRWLRRWLEVRLAGREHALLAPFIRSLEGIGPASSL